MGFEVEVVIEVWLLSGSGAVANVGSDGMVGLANVGAASVCSLWARANALVRMAAGSFSGELVAGAEMSSLSME